MEHAVFPEIPVLDPEAALADDAERNCGDHRRICRCGIELFYSTFGRAAFGRAAFGRAVVVGAVLGSWAAAWAAARAMS